METIRDKRVLITGATGGIGMATARLLASGGAKLFLTGRNAEKLAGLAASLQIPESQYFAADISDPEQVKKLAEQYFGVFPGIDILVNAAGIGLLKPVQDISDLEFLRTLHINLYAPFLLMKAFLPSMKEAKKGLVIQIPGVLGKTPMQGAAAYSASKYGLHGMMQSIREECKRTEIRFTSVFMGGVDSPFWDSIDLKVQREKMIRAEEAARTIWFLCQQPSSAVVSEMVVQPFNHQAI